MAIPASAIKWTPKMDPSDLVDYQIDLSGADSILETGELVDTFNITVLSEGTALGFIVENTAPYAPTIVNGNKITLWFSVAEANRSNTAFTTGVQIPMELEIITTSSPPRKRQRTFVVEVQHL